MDMNDYRKQIDSADEGLLKSFIDRMHTAADIARFKHGNNIPIFDSERERQKILAILGKHAAGTEIVRIGAVSSAV